MFVDKFLFVVHASYTQMPNSSHTFDISVLSRTQHPGSSPAMLPRLTVLLVAAGCGLGAAQRRLRDRTRTSDLGAAASVASPASRTLFEEPQTSASFQSPSFFSELDWTDPTFSDIGSIPEWGFKKTAVPAPAPALMDTEAPVEEVADRRDSIRRYEAAPQRPTRPERGNRRSLIGVRTKASPYRLQPQRAEDRADTGSYKPRPRSRERLRPPAPASRVEQLRPASPGNLRVNSMRVASVQEEVNRAELGDTDHPGDISFGLFGAGDIGGGQDSYEVPAPRVTTYRPASFVPVTTYRPKRFQAALPSSFTSASPELSYDRDSEWGNQRLAPAAAAEERLFHDKRKEGNIRDFVEKIYKKDSPIKPARWNPSPPVVQKPRPIQDNFGSPYFSLDPSDFKEDNRPSRTPPPPAPAKRPSMFLPTLTPPEVQSTPKSILSFDPDFINEKEETIENVFVPTQMSTTDPEPVRVSTSAARDAERRADMAINSKKQLEETPAAAPPQPQSADTSPDSDLASDSDNLRKWRDELYSRNDEDAGQSYSNTGESMTTPKFEINPAFMEGRSRGLTTTPRSVNQKEDQKLNFVPTLPPLDNVLEENAYSKTHIRKQKIVPRTDSVEDDEVVVKDVLKKSDDDIVLKGTKLVSSNGNNFGKTFLGSLKPIDGGKVDYMDLTMTDITKVLPLSKLSSVLKRHGFSASDIFNRNAEALKIVGKAMKSIKLNKKGEDENLHSALPFSTVAPKEREKEIDIVEENDGEDDPYGDLNIEFKEWSPTMKLSEDKGVQRNSNVPQIKMPWPKRPAMTKSYKKKTYPKDPPKEKQLKSSWDDDEINNDVGVSLKDEQQQSQQNKKVTVDNRRVKTPKRYGWTDLDDKEEVQEESGENAITQTENNIEEEIEKEASTMSFKSLVKKISPMSLSEVLSHVGYSLPDIMRGNKKAIKEVLIYHRKKMDPDAFKNVKKETSLKDSKSEVKVNDETESPINMDEVETTSTTTTTTTTTTADETEPVKTAVDIFKNCKACKRLFSNMRSSTTTKSTSSPQFRFGQRTSKDNIERTSPTNIRTLTTKQRKRKPLPDTISERNDAADDITEDETEANTTVFPSLNFTLANLNMSRSDVLDKQDLSVPRIEQIFDPSNHAKKSDIIYGKKEAGDEKAATKRPKVFKNTDPFFNNGGGRVRWSSGAAGGGAPYGGGGGYGGGYGGYGGGGGGSLVTDRRTTKPTKKPTTRIPITYFGLEDELENSNPNLKLSGDYNGVDYDYEYDYTDYYGPVSEVPTGVKSALIASSVVGGLAVSIFLCIFMLCLWKNMKSKLRMSSDFDDNSSGFLSGLMFKKSKKGNKKDQNGYFNKVLPIGEQHYSTTSSEEY